ncbi:hypothetical protein Ddye_022602 [Dipteronia dyeriana]|uniref:F-box domain-containing protein n=1 Tax=Dipteronia dyeriana TaxID=168575 RepID=A0AAD9TRC9_9ROSI|nr:hypothetical protein Ddye_022602 [Dipteronia dyeriana]
MNLLFVLYIKPVQDIVVPIIVRWVSNLRPSFLCLSLSQLIFHHLSTHTIDHLNVIQYTMENLPRDVALDIFSRLPVSSLVQIKCVCKSWCALAEETRLPSMHHAHATSRNPCLVLNSACQTENKLQFICSGDGFNQYSSKVRSLDGRFNTAMSEYQVVGSCNGLLCVSNSYYYDPITICNPIIGDYIELPKSTQFPMQEVALGFGYLPTSMRYKVVRFVFYIKIEIWSLESHAEILTLGTDHTWRSIGPVPGRLELKPSQALVNGALHWVTLFFHFTQGIRLRVISFDLTEEKFRWIELPSFDCTFASNCHLVALEGCLSAVHHLGDEGIDIWVMKEYEVEESWIKKYAIGMYVPASLVEPTRPHINKVVCILNMGKILLHCNNGAFVLYNPESEQFNDLTISGLPKSFSTIVHVESLLLIEEILGINTDALNSKVISRVGESSRA